jgi:xylulokinase
MKAVLGIDLGTSFFKIGLVDAAGVFIGFSRITVVPVKGTLGSGHRFELPVPDFIAGVRQGIADCLSKSGYSAADIDGISYASQANSFLLLDGEDKPLTNLILWPDTRRGMDPAVRELWKAPKFIETTATGVRGNISAVNKIRWLQEHRPDIWKRTRHIMTISDYLLFLLTEERKGDEGTASLLGLYDLKNSRWWVDALRLLDIPREYLNTPLMPGSFAGSTTDKSARLFGLADGIPVFAGSLDHHVAAVGAGAGTIAPMCDSTGTVLACLAPADEYAPKENQCFLPNVGGIGYSRIAFTENSADVLAWYQREYAPQMNIGDLIKEAEHVPPGCGGLTACPCADAYPGLSGFSVPPGRNFSGGHYVRAIMESVAESLKGLARSLLDSGEEIPPMAAAGGGAKSDLWLRIKADLLNTTMVRTAVDEPACYGAAMIAAAGRGWFPSVRKAAASWVKAEKEFWAS